MKYIGKIKKLDSIVLSDPYYDKDTWCRYSKENINGKDWITNLEIETSQFEDFPDIEEIKYTLLLKNDKDTCELTSDGGLSYFKDIKLKEYEIGADSACIAFGINEHAKDIINSKEEWQPTCALKTGGDEIFAYVCEGIKNDKLQFLLLNGFINKEMYNEQDILNYIINNFEIIDLTEIKEMKGEKEACIG